MASKAIALNKKTRRLMIHETVTSYLFLLPFLLFFFLFVVYPMFMCVWTSFFDATMGREDIFIGLDNYKTLFKDPVFWVALRNTAVIVIVSVPVTCGFSLWIASVISKMHVAATSLFRCVFYLPVVTGSVAVTMVWKWMFNYSQGIFNYIGTETGLLEKGINYALGTDSVASNNNLNLMEEVKLCATLFKATTGDPTVVTPAQALYAATRAGALAQGRSDCGLVKEGFRADLIVLDLRNKPHMYPCHSMVNNVVFAGQGSDVCLTMVDGQVLYRDGLYTTMDVEAVIAKANESTANILRQL